VVTSLDRLVAHLAMRQPRQVVDAARREAAVALILQSDPDRVLVVRRVTRASDPWSGQLALPGGRREASDDSLLTTAIRETVEEVGIALLPSELRFTLDDLAPATPALPAMVVRPFAFVPTAESSVVLSGELDHAEWVSFEQLLQPGTRQARELTVRGVSMRRMGYVLPAGFLWGMTERILSPVIDAWRELNAAATISGLRASGSGPPMP
jgi:8-oxo-dGTP pyrophosphatase MutT (NUDIX family)